MIVLLSCSPIFVLTTGMLFIFLFILYFLFLFCQLRPNTMCYWLFASFFLLPKLALIEELGSKKREKITLEEMIDIKELYGASLAASIIAARDYGIITTEYKRAWYAEHIEPNPREIGNGHYAFPETLGREKRVNSIVDS